MELGELLFVLIQEISDYAEKAFDAYNLPTTLRPIVMRGVEAHFAENACDHMIAVKLSAQQTESEPKEPEKQTRSGEGLESLQKSLKNDFGKNADTVSEDGA